MRSATGSATTTIAIALNIDPSGAVSTPLGVDQDLETAVEHTLVIEGHRLRIHHPRKSRILHHLRVDPIAMRARLEYDPREHHRLAALELDAATERHPRVPVEV